MAGKYSKTRGNYFAIRFNTGGYTTQNFSNKKDAITHAVASNRYSETHHGERIVSAVEEYRNWELYKTYTDF